MKKYTSKHKNNVQSRLSNKQLNNKHKQGAISLSMNLLVILIISLVILGMGVTLLYKMVGTALVEKEKLDARTQQELLRLLVDEGKKVALPLHIADLYGNEKHVFGIGILIDRDWNPNHLLLMVGITGMSCLFLLYLLK
ncbi:hypothetical protein HYT52_00760, partial [Candidatus Woesearchaeota archaeon]|nr:hypothetical protein [Candidatus Woesearchaeota archaeon]